MSLFRHVIVLFFIFATYHISISSAKLEDDHSTPNTTKPDYAKFIFNRTSGPLRLKIIMEKDECVKTNTETCQTDDPLRNAEQEENTLGTEKKPAESCNDVDETGYFYIKTKMSHQAFNVKCDVQEKATCIYKNSKINASSIDSVAITKGDEIWLSQTDFITQLLYNKIEGVTGTNTEQISYLLSTSISVNQTIRYYYSNGTKTKPEDSKVASLKALLWNDHLVSSNISNQLPMQFTYNETGLCWDGNSHWVCSDLIFKDNSNKRLPVTDFYIADIQDKVDILQKLYFELVELCFMYE